MKQSILESMQNDQKKPEIIPLLLLKGRTILFREYSKKVLTELSKNLRKRGFEKLYVMDIDGIEKNKPQLDIIQRLADDFTIYYEAGPRRGANIVDVVIAGAEMAYMNTASMVSLHDLKIALSYTENVGLKIDWNNGVLGNGEDIIDSDLNRIMKKSNEIGIVDFVFPVEIFDKVSKIHFEKKPTLRALADRPGDEERTDLNVESIIVNFGLLK